jgi:OmpA-OmpF porin, OOP family
LPAPEKIILRGVHFDFDKLNIRPQDAVMLDGVAETLKTHQKVSANVNGCNAIGTVRYNLRLPQRWSNAVVKYLRHGRVRNEI